MYVQNRFFFCLSAAFALALVGCDPGTMGVAKVTGKVTHDGKPVTGGSISFQPKAAAAGSEAGKSGGAVVQADGTYQVSTYGENDGAVVGKHTIRYMPPTISPPGEASDGTPPEFSPFHNMVPKTTEVEVAAKDNVIDIELVNP